MLNHLCPLPPHPRRAMPEAAVRRRQEVLQRERLKFYYAVPPGRQTSALADIVFTNLLNYGRRVATGQYHL